MTTTTPNASLRPARQTTEPREVLGEAAWLRSAAVAGVAFVVLDVVGTFLPGTAPASDASAAKVAAYFTHHAGAIKAELLVAGLGIAALLWWTGALWRMLSRAEGDRPRLTVVAALGLGAGLTLALLNGALIATAAIRVDDVATTHMFYSLSLVVIAAAGFGIGTALIAASTITYRTKIVPGWISYVGWAAGLAFLASTLGSISSANAVNLIGLLAFLVWCVWILAVSGVMWRDARAA